MNALAADLIRQTSELSASVVTRPIPGSRKIHVPGSRADLRVPMREVALADTPLVFGAEKNPPLALYDTSGPYTDPKVGIDLVAGLAPLARALDRGARRQRTPQGPELGVRAQARHRSQACRRAFTARGCAAPRQGRRERIADALRAPRHRHAGNGIHRDPRESATRMPCRTVGSACTTSRRELRRGDSARSSRPNSCAAKLRAAARSFRATSTIRKASR